VIVRLLLIGLSVMLISSAAIARPNVVVILTDDQDGTGSISHMPKVLSLLAEQGVTFTNSFVNMSLCAPSRASFLTGQAAHNHGIIGDQAPSGGWQKFIPLEGNTLPVWLQATGYHTALFGKYLNAYGKFNPSRQSWLGALAHSVGWSNGTYQDDGDPHTWVPPGWDLWFAFAETGYYGSLINENGKLLKISDYSTDVLRDRAVRFIHEQSQTTAPFFMLIATKAPHTPAIPSHKYEQAFGDIKLPMSPAFNERNVSQKPPVISELPTLDEEKIGKLQKRYRGVLQTLLSVDDLVEAVVDALQSTGKLEDTIIIYTSDNGMMLGDHRWVGKYIAYEGSIRVPLVMRGPGIPKNETRSQLVNNLDAVATIEQLTHVTPGIAPDGRSLSPLFTDSTAPWRSAILVEALGQREAAVRTATRKYVAYKHDFEELYDLSVDPYELENKAKDPSYASDLASLRPTLDGLRRCSGSSCWVP
jgi:N-acetylglucosamine-6-sulfatase